MPMIEPPAGLVHAIQSEPLVAAVWAEAERAGLTVERAVTAVALELLADNVRYRRAEVERQTRGRIVWQDKKNQVFVLERNAVPTVVESAP